MQGRKGNFALGEKGRKSDKYKIKRRKQIGNMEREEGGTERSIVRIETIRKKRLQIIYW